MPVLLIFSLIIQLALVVHIVKSGRTMTWIFVGAAVWRCCSNPRTAAAKPE